MRTPPRHRRTLLGAFLLLAAAPIAPSAADAQEDVNGARGAQLFAEGKAAMAKNDYATACAKFSESMKIAPRPNVVFNLAQCEEHEGRLVNARKHWADAQAAIDSRDPRVAIAKDRIAALDKRVASLVLRLAAGTPPQAHVKIDGAEVDKSAIGAATPVDPGAHVVTLEAAGRKESRTSLTLAEGEKKEATLSPGAVDPSYVPPAPERAHVAPDASARPPAAAPASSTKRTVGFVLGGIGIAGLAVAAVTGGLAVAKNGTIQSDCPNKRCSQEGLDAISGQNALFAANYVGWGVGIAGVAAGAFLVLTSKGGASAPTTAIAPAPLPGGAALRIESAF
jgi:hypothetical protein